MSRAVLLGLLFLTAVALAFRCPQLDRRPMHNDEAVNACKFELLWGQGSYKYDPNEFHGPTLPYLTFALSKATGAPQFSEFTESRLRWVTVLAGAGLILLLPLVADGLGRIASFFAALLTAISPAMVFYSRYYIHEMLLVFFTFLAMGAVWRYTRNPKIGWALLAGVSFGLMAATKETFVLQIAAAAGAFVLTWLLSERARPRAQQGVSEQTRQNFPINSSFLRNSLAALVACLIVIILLFSSFFSNPSGIADAVRTYLPWLHRAGGASPHIHPWYFYLERLAWFHPAAGPYWSEGLILLLAAVGCVAAFCRSEIPGINRQFIRFLVFYTLLLTIIYSAIAYKTPWCMLGFLHGLILLAGVGVAALGCWIKGKSLKTIFVILLATALGRLGCQAWQASQKYAADRRNPYVYSPTSLDLSGLVHKVENLAAVDPQGDQMVVKIMSPNDDYWPLPWYLRRFSQVGWWNQVPSDPYAPVMIVSTQLKAALDEKKTHIMVGIFELRPQVFLELYVEKSLWEKYLAQRPRFENSPDET